ncbi:protein HIT1, partial [Lipomyces arxii]|uniref:protein HIT1 n=1 Tax=Lipomyces arxii TaxID=56418 RepID=UPI0034CEE03C
VICEICKQNKAAYRCPKCDIRYCSLTCYKDPNHVHPDAAPVIEKQDETVTDSDVIEVAEQPANPQTLQYRVVLADPDIQNMLQSPTLQHHLMNVFDVLSDPAVSGEQTAAGRRDVALKKLRELRAGGVESNVEIEEFVTRLCHLLERSE